MKRSEINHLIIQAEKFFNEHQFFLPIWASWNLEDWHNNKARCEYISTNMLGWDITDFGSGDFYKRGLFLFTIRNGKLGCDRKPYAEKIMIVEEGQETPLHYHAYKMEDIINRGGGNLVLELFNVNESNNPSDTPVKFRIDGIEHEVPCGEKVVLHPGSSICIEQRIYHRFYGEEGKGKVLVGEVSMVNDDNTDNYFYEPVGRFPSIDEDELPIHLLVSDYSHI